MSLEDYRRKRDFSQTTEPEGKQIFSQGPLLFVVQLHEASRLHYDFRIEAGGVLKSWAVPKGPSLNPLDQRLAVQVEDHPLDYGGFEGIIPKGNYGAGTVMIWDEGTYLERTSEGREDSEKKVLDGIENGHVTLLLSGQKLRGEFALIRLKKGDEKSWLLIKKRDEFASYSDVTRASHSARTGRTLQEIAEQSPQDGKVWLPKRSSPEEPVTPVKKGTLPPPPSLPDPSSETDPIPEKFPHRLKPMIPVVREDLFEQKGWIYQIDRGGYRTIAELQKGVVHLYSKQLLPFGNKFPKVVGALQRVQISAVLDGEITEDQVFWVWDILHLEGYRLRDLPWVERKRRLAQLELFGDQIRYVEDLPFSEDLLALNPTGIFARAAYSPYAPGVSKSWFRIQAKGRKGPTFSHLNKVYWPKDGLTKGDLIEYYRRVAPYLLPHLKDRPESMHRHPDGIEQPGFFQKDWVGHIPAWVQTERVVSGSSKRSIDYLLCQNEWTLLYMVNLGCIELNPWLSRVGNLDQPDFTVIDLDPDDNPFPEVVQVALEIHRVLERLGAAHFCKTSGSTGIHIYVPVQAPSDYDTSREFALAVCEEVHQVFPENTSLERSPSKRRHRIYLDCFQNARGQTVAAPYCVRPKPGAPVSTPLLWEELNPSLRLQDFNIRTVPARLAEKGDLWKSIFQSPVDLKACLLSLRKNLPKE